MSGTRLRPARADDLAALSAIWTRSFGDPPDFVRAMLTDAGLLSAALCAEEDEQVRSAMFAFEGLRFRGVFGAYLYALATDPAARGRGLGGAVCTALARRCFARGAAFVCLSPADAGLARWYGTLGFRALYAMADLPVGTAGVGGKCTRLSAADYRAARTGPLCLTPQLLAAQEILHRFDGGGFFRVETGGATALACAEPADGRVLIRELICPPEAVPAAAGAIAEAFSAKSALLRRRVPDGAREVYIMFNPEAAENLRSLDFPVFPYLLE